MTTQGQAIQFGEWLPDLPEYNNPGAILAQNVIPQLGSFRQLDSLNSFTDALASAALGAIWTRDDTGIVYNFAGDVSALYQLTGNTVWSDVSGVSAPYTATDWDFAKFGALVIATNGLDVVQQFDVNVPDVAFSDLAGTPPVAKRVATVRDFLVLGNGPVIGPNFLQWSGFNNAELWTPSIATQSDSQELTGRGGDIQRIMGGDVGYIWQENSIWRMDYTGPPTIFQFDEIEKNRGTPSGNSVVRAGGMYFYYHEDGFYKFDGRSNSIPISHNRVAKWMNANSAVSALGSMFGAVDRINRLIVWGFKSSSSSVQNDRLIIYNYQADKWAYAEVDTQILVEHVSGGFTLDELDVPLPAGIDIDSINVDSDIFQGGALSLSAFDASNQLGSFDGTPLVATIDTKEISGPDSQRLMTNSVRPLVEGNNTTSTTVQIGSRNLLENTPTFTAERATNAQNGEANVRVNSRYQRYRLNISGGFNHANGVRPQSRAGGGRR